MNAEIIKLAAKNQNEEKLKLSIVDRFSKTEYYFLNANTLCARNRIPNN